MIINPKSGKANARAKLLDALNVFSKYGHSVEVYVTQKSKDAQLKAKEEGYKYDLVIACGGDGTLNEVTNGLMCNEIKPIIGYFPTGTMNDFGSNFNLSSDWKETAERICTGEIHEFDVGLFNNESYFDYVAAFGAMCDVPYVTPQDIKNQLGNLAYLIEGLGRITEIKPIKVKVTTKEKTEEFTSILGTVFSGNRVSGIEFISKEEGKVDDGIFNCVIVEYPGNIIEQDYLSFFTGMQSKAFHWYKSDEITLEFMDEDVKWTIDGEKADSSKTVNIRNINRALRILN